MKFSTNKLLYIRRAVFAVLIILTAVLQNTKGAVPSIASVHALPTIALVVAVAMHEKSVPALFFGAFGGIMLDTFSSSTDGFFAVMLAVTGFACSLLIIFQMRNNILSAVLLTLGSAFLCNLFYWIFFILIKGYDLSVYVYFRYYFTSTIYTALLAFIYYYLIHFIVKLTASERKRINY